MSSYDGPLTREGLRVCSEMCTSCVFRPGNLMELRAGRVRGLVREAQNDDSAIVCHKTLDGDRAVCRGYWDRHQRDTLLCRLGLIHGTIEIDPDARSRPS